jgi:hypothetical protein
MKTAKSDWRGIQTGETKPDSVTKQQILEKVRKRLAELGFTNTEPAPLFQKAIPDVIVISDDHVLLFEPQNWPATEWLHRRCGLSMDNAQVRDQIRVHPCQRLKIINDLKAAGFEVVF